MLEFIVVQDPVMLRLHADIARIATSSVHVLVTGETGVGKEIVAESLHRRSPRAAGPFIRVNCAAIPESLIESELFGHERGAFTGAISSRPGLIEAADGGTMLFDEIGELPAALQAKLLRVTEAREVTRIGGVRPRPIDVRFVAATNRNMAHAVRRGIFRADLFYRLNTISIDVPPLRERPGDIQALAQLFVRRASERLSQAPSPISAAAMDALLDHAWPGNVRELQNAIERAVLLRTSDSIEPSDLGLVPSKRGRAPASRDDARSSGFFHRSLRASDGGAADREAERERILDALQRCQHNQTRAARLLGMPRRTLVAKLSAYDIPRPRKAISCSGDAVGMLRTRT